MEEHADDHGGRENECKGLTRWQQCNGRARAYACQPPPNAKHCRANDQVPVDLTLIGNVQRRSEHRSIACADPSIGDR